MIDDAAGVTGHYPITWATQNYNIGTRAFKMLSELTAIIIRIIWTFPFKKIIIIIYVHITFVQLGTRVPSPQKSNPSITNTLDQYPHAAHQNRIVWDILENEDSTNNVQQIAMSKKNRIIFIYLKKIKILLKRSTNCDVKRKKKTFNKLLHIILSNMKSKQNL